MTLSTDDQGKIFTEVVHKEGVKVLIQTHTNQIRGTIHRREGKRVLDKLNDAAKFIPLTQVVVYDGEGKVEMQRAEFLAIGRDEIIWLIEEETATAQEGK